MFIKQLSVQGYKCFFGEGSINFSLPKGDIGSGMTVLVGPNNSGKTTFMESLKKVTPRDKNQKYIYQEESNTSTFEVKVLDLEDKEKLVKRQLPHSAVLSISGDSSFSNEHYSIVPSRRHRQSDFSQPLNFQGYSNNVFGREKNSIDSHFGGLLEHIEGHTTLKGKFDEMLKYLLPGIQDWSIQRTRRGSSIAVILQDGSTHPSDYLGDGVISIFQLVAVIVDENKDIIVIDEPEVSLQPDVIRRLLRQLSELSKTKQVIISTHSPYFVSRINICNGANIYRFQKEGIKSKLFTINKDEDYYTRIISSPNWQTPHLMDVVAKEILFTQNVLFLEGQEDASLLRSYIEDNDIECNFTIFGYGIGGADNLDWYLGLTADLGIKAGAILDGDKVDKANELQKKYSEFKIGTISTDDIRDKYKQKYSADKIEKVDDYYLINGRGRNSNEMSTEGLFDKHGQVKDSSIEELNSIISDYNSFFG